MRSFNRGYALVFLLMIVVAILAVRLSYQRVEGRFQGVTGQYAQFTVDDWLEFLRLEELLGDPPVTPFPVDELPPPALIETPAPPDIES